MRNREAYVYIAARRTDERKKKTMREGSSGIRKGEAMSAEGRRRRSNEIAAGGRKRGGNIAGYRMGHR